jgi:hypothetical protein
MAADDNEATVGLNPFRQQRRRPSDYVLVAGAVLLTLLLVAWGLGLV